MLEDKLDYLLNTREIDTMQDQDTEKKIKRIADYYKVKHQEQKLVEELGELLIEISKNMIANKVTDNTASEIADVIILLTQIIYLYDIEQEVYDKYIFKIDREIKRILRRLKESI